jgi:hypothetical protein
VCKSDNFFHIDDFSPHCIVSLATSLALQVGKATGFYRVSTRFRTKFCAVRAF